MKIIHSAFFLFVVFVLTLSCVTISNNNDFYDDKIFYKSEYRDTIDKAISFYKKGMDCDAIDFLLKSSSSILFSVVNTPENINRENDIKVANYFISLATRMLSYISLEEVGENSSVFAKKIRTIRNQSNGVRVPIVNANIVTQYSDKYSQLFISDSNGVINAYSPYLDILPSGEVGYYLFFSTAEKLNNNYQNICLNIANFLKELNNKKIIYQYSSMIPKGKIAINYNIKSDVAEIRDPKVSIDEIAKNIGFKDYLVFENESKNNDSIYIYKINVDCLVDEAINFNSECVVHLSYNLNIENVVENDILYRIDGCEVLDKGGSFDSALRNALEVFYTKIGKIIRAKVLQDSIKQYKLEYDGLNRQFNNYGNVI